MLRSDQQLIAGTRRGEAQAFGELFGRYRALVLAYLVRRCVREDAADLLAETFAAALIAVHDGRAPGTETVAPWLLTIAHNKLIDAHRRGRVEDRMRRRLALERVEPDYEELEAVGMDVDAALSALPSADQTALRARVLDEQPYEAIARELDTTEPAVRQRVSRALRRLRTDLEKQR